MDLAQREGRILLTEDKDFGRLVHVAGARTAGVILIRFPSQKRAELSQSVLSLVRDKGPQLGSGFAVLQPGRVRFEPELDAEE